MTDTFLENNLSTPNGSRNFIYIIIAQRHHIWTLLQWITSSLKFFFYYSLNFFYLGERNLTSSTAFLFSLQNPEYLQPVKLEINASSINRGAIAALSDPLLGPVFGDGDLVISDMASTGIFSYSKLGRTYLLPDGIDPNTAAARNLLAGSANFIPDEIEVFAYEGKKNFSHYLSQNIIKLTGTFLLDIWIFT